MILKDFFKKYHLSEKSQRVIKRKPQHIAQAVSSEFLDQPPLNLKEELDELTKKARD